VENQDIRTRYALSAAELLAAFRNFARLEHELVTLRFDVFKDMRRLLQGRDNHTTCVWNACDPYTTRAVHGVEGNGQRTNCGRTNKDGVDFVKADQPGFERYIALYKTPQAHGGCAGCRFFLVCKGQCPGTAIDGDWRNRTEHCELWKNLYAELEASLLERGELPLSVRSERQIVEDTMLRCWELGANPMIESILRAFDGQESASPQALAAKVLAPAPRPN